MASTGSRAGLSTMSGTAFGSFKKASLMLSQAPRILAPRYVQTA